MKLTCHISRPSISYDIEFSQTQPVINDSFGKSFVIVTDSIVEELYAKKLHEQLLAAGFTSKICSFPCGEAFKTRATKEHIEDTMLQSGCGRDTVLIALGGGVVTDVGGFVAATYCRGIPLIMMPTTLLGMVDASIGGKTGVNVPAGKNLLGCIYQPRKVYIDLSTLETLPQKNMQDGFVEMIKHAIISSPSYFERLETRKFPLDQAIADSCLIKMSFFQEDELDYGKRSFLNLGHTVGHALEIVSNYTISHGEAVALGIIMEGKMAVDKELLSETSLSRIISLFSAYSLPTRLQQHFAFKDVFSAMCLDKKSILNTPRFVLLNDIGNPHSCSSLEANCIENAFRWIQE